MEGQYNNCHAGTGVLLRIPYEANLKKKTNKQTNNAVLKHCVGRKHSYTMSNFWSYFIVCFSIVSPLGSMKPEPHSDWGILFP